MDQSTTDTTTAHEIREIETCEHCKGVKTVRYAIEEGPAGTHPKVNPTSAFKLCTCPLPKPHHDGKLEPMVAREGDEGNTAYVELFDSNPLTSLIHLSGGYTIGHVVEVYLDPLQSLSLLAWLTQNEPALKAMVRVEALACAYAETCVSEK